MKLAQSPRIIGFIDDLLLIGEYRPGVIELDDLKETRFRVSFKRYRSDIQVKLFGKSQNYTLYIGVPEDFPFKPGHQHFTYPGSWEAVETEIRKDIELLAEQGFRNIEFCGYVE